MRTTRKWTAALIVIVLIVGIVVATTYLTRRPAPSISLAPTTFVAVQGTAITFTVFGLESNGIATVYFGDGHEANTTSTVSYTYPDAGRYLVAAQECVNGQPVSSTFNALQTIQMTPQVSESLAPLISLPVVAFDVNRNPSAPVVRVDDQLYLYGGYLQPPSGTNITITQYVWDFGNGAIRNLGVNETSLNPAENPATATYTQPGLYPVTLTLVTENSSSMATYRTSIEQTVAVGSGSQPYALFLYAGIVPNPTVINIAENLNPYGNGYYSLDPNLSVNQANAEICSNIFSTLLIYNGSSTTNFIPEAASEVPSVSNGGISPDYTSYTFHVRQGIKFSNGDPLTAYDVWYSMIRSLLFSMLGTSWITAQYLLPNFLDQNFYGNSLLVANATDIAGYNRIMNSMAYSNASDTITFKLIRPIAPQLFFTVLANAEGFGIIDSLWLQRVGAGITFTPAGFYAYQKVWWNPPLGGSEVDNDPIGSGPYMIQSYALGQSISLVPNPGFPGISGNPGIPKANNTLVIQWVKYPETLYELFRSGQADIVTQLPPRYFPLIKQQVANGQAKLYQFPTLTAFMIYTRGWAWNGEFNETAMKTEFGSQYHMPNNYFLNLDVRKAFAYAFNYTYYLDEILGNKRYGVEIGSSYAGFIVQGLPYHVPESEFQNVPVYNLTYAKQLLQESGEYNTPVHIPFPISPYYAGASGMDSRTKFAAAQMYADAIHSIDPNIVITPTIHTPAGAQPSIPIQFNGWYADYPYPSDFVDPWYGDSVAPDWLNSTGHPDQAAMYAQMNALIADADSTTNATRAAEEYKQVEQIAINLYLYVYLYQLNSFYVVKPYMNGYQGQISYLMNPMVFTTQYVWWVKTCGSIQACSGRNIGP